MRYLNYWDIKNFWGAKSGPPSPATSVKLYIYQKRAHCSIIDKRVTDHEINVKSNYFTPQPTTSIELHRIYFLLQSNSILVDKMRVPNSMREVQYRKVYMYLLYSCEQYVPIWNSWPHKIALDDHRHYKGEFNRI